jgi:glutamyl-Q tRNA(Asp) synthetase
LENVMSLYVGRFAPSPTGDLHAGSIACALASYLDARAHGGTWLIRIENIDPPREVAGAIGRQLRELERLGMRSDRPVLYQSGRDAAYRAAFDTLKEKGLIYACICSRSKIIQEALRLGLKKGVYPGTCRTRAGDAPPHAAWRLRVDTEEAFTDRWQGFFSQNLPQDVGDFVIKRADGLWAYQLAVVTDDAFQGVTHIVRGADLLDNTPRQIALQKALGLPTPIYLHIPIVRAADGEKLSKQNGATSVSALSPEEVLRTAWRNLGFEPFGFTDLEDFYEKAKALWAKRFL